MTDTKTNGTGHFSWHELVSRDIEGAKGFYGELLGWSFDAMKMGDGSEYPLIQAGGASIGGLVAPPAEDVPPHWVGYVTVGDVDATAKKVAAKGGATLMDAFDVPGVGRIQAARDPQGGVFMLFAPEGEEGDGSGGGRGRWHWNELWSSDADASAAFYADVLGVERDTMDMPNGAYHLLKRGEQPLAGIMQSPSSEVPTHWAFYVEVEDADAARDRAVKLGGEAQGDVMEVPGVGRFGFVVDREGARLGVITPAAE